MKYKFSIGDVVVLKECRRAYQLKNKIKIKYRKKAVDEYGKYLKYWRNLYSDDRMNWYPENILKRL